MTNSIMDVQKLTQDELIHQAAAEVRSGNVTNARPYLFELLHRFGLSSMHCQIVGNVSNNDPSMLPMRYLSYGIFEHGTLYNFQPSTVAVGSTYWYNGKQYLVLVNQTHHYDAEPQKEYATTRFLAIALPALPHVDDDHAREQELKERDERPFYNVYLDMDIQ